ncbi:hypothetical protein SCLCIDRAFT_1212289 [Scleroderma citrinum Foug A]|uniref:Uncharacterized protein n=1 Tax=Scleroderma citrinum Foug A TaxID=1036808 RepID=A0A0C3AKS3_9AGAM|nr:hypothetical protein SCLCIDRAFT_1212289 [Scleroderma citrinum Foug A]
MVKDNLYIVPSAPTNPSQQTQRFFRSPCILHKFNKVQLITNNTRKSGIRHVP